MKRLALFLAPILAFVPAAAWARATSVDAPGDMLLFILGVSGLVIGRSIIRHRHGPDDRG